MGWSQEATVLPSCWITIRDSGCHNGAILIQSVAAELGVPVENVVYHPHLMAVGDKISGLATR